MFSVTRELERNRGLLMALSRELNQLRRRHNEVLGWSGDAQGPRLKPISIKGALNEHARMQAALATRKK